MKHRDRVVVLGTLAIASFQFIDVAVAQTVAAPMAKVALSAAATLGSARVSCTGDELAVSTGVMERKWRWTGKGLVTTSLRDVRTKQEWAGTPRHTCDWDLPGVLGDGVEGILIGSSARVDDDDGFSGKHLEVVTTVHYERARLQVQHVVWAFPDSPGIRTQLRVKALPGYAANGTADDRKYFSYGGTLLRRRTKRLSAGRFFAAQQPPLLRHL